MKVLNLIIKKVWFDKILKGEKTSEFRELKPTTWSRYAVCDANGPIVKDGVVTPLEYDAIRLCVGYNKNRPVALVECKGVTIYPVEDEDGEQAVDFHKGVMYDVYVAEYKLGRILSTKNV